MALSLSVNKTYDLLAFIDDAVYLQGRTLKSIPIESKEYLSKFSKNIDQILLAIPSLKGTKRKNLLKKIEALIYLFCKYPLLKNWDQVKKIDYLSPVAIEDLIYRDRVESDKELLNKSINSAVVCVTGGAGSIGSELCRKIIRLKPKSLIIFDNNEHRLFEILNEINKINLDKDIKIIIQLGNTTNEELVKKTFLDHNVDVVFHAAAYKHVPLVELNPLEGIFNNVVSTKSYMQSIKICKLKESSFNFY